MEKISISNIVEFRRKSSKSQITFINNLKKPKPENNSEDGGNYWVHSLSTVSKVFVNGEAELLNKKIAIINDKRKIAKTEQTKNMFQKNIDILHNFEDFDFLQFKPNTELKYLSKPKYKSILKIKGVPVQVLPQHVFTFEEGKTKKIGAIWIVAKIKGYKSDELGIFTDALYRYLKLNYSDDFKISSNFCVVIDAINLKDVKYSQILKKEIPSLLTAILELIKKLIK